MKRKEKLELKKNQFSCHCKYVLRKTGSGQMALKEHSHLLKSASPRWCGRKGLDTLPPIHSDTGSQVRVPGPIAPDYQRAAMVLEHSRGKDRQVSTTFLLHSFPPLEQPQARYACSGGPQSGGLRLPQCQSKGAIWPGSLCSYELETQKHRVWLSSPNPCIMLEFYNCIFLLPPVTLALCPEEGKNLSGSLGQSGLC